MSENNQQGTNNDQNEIEWIKQKEAAMDAAEAEWQGGSGAPMARNMAVLITPAEDVTILYL